MIHIVVKFYSLAGKNKTKKDFKVSFANVFICVKRVGKMLDAIVFGAQLFKGC